MISIHDDFLPVLQGWRDADLSNGKNDGDYIITYRGKPVDRISRAFATVKRKAGITRKLPPYAFRHGFAAGVLAAVADLKSTSEILGHSRSDTTTRIYQHTDMELHRRSIGKLPALEIPKRKYSLW